MNAKVNQNITSVREKIQQGLEMMGVPTEQDKTDLVAAYFQILAKWNRAYNLTGLPEEDWVTRIALESVGAGLAAGDFREGSCADFGSGAGIPGMTIGICWPRIPLDLVDSRVKRTDFLTHMVSKLNLQNVHVLQQRIEKLGSEYLEKYDVIWARALAAPDVVAELAWPFLKPNGRVIIPCSGKEPEKELLCNNTRGYRIEALTMQIPFRLSKSTFLKLFKE